MGPSGRVGQAKLLTESTSLLSGALGLPTPAGLPPARAPAPPEAKVSTAKLGCHRSQYLSDGSEGRRSMKMVGGSAGLLSCLLWARPSSAWMPAADLR